MKKISSLMAAGLFCITLLTGDLKAFKMPSMSATSVAVMAAIQEVGLLQGKFENASEGLTSLKKNLKPRMDELDTAVKAKAPDDEVRKKAGAALGTISNGLEKLSTLFTSVLKNVLAKMAKAAEKKGMSDNLKKVSETFEEMAKDVTTIAQALGYEKSSEEEDEEW